MNLVRHSMVLEGFYFILNSYNFTRAITNFIKRQAVKFQKEQKHSIAWDNLVARNKPFILECE